MHQFETIEEFLDAVETGVLENEYTTTRWINRALNNLCQRKSWPYRNVDREVNRELPLCDEFLCDIAMEIQRITELIQSGHRRARKRKDQSFAPGSLDQRDRVRRQGVTAIDFLSQFLSESTEIELID